jgi:hypothetical protein
MPEDLPDLLTGTEVCLVAEVPGAGNRWTQVHFNKDIARQFFNLQPGMERSITLERISASGRVQSRTSRQLVFPERNRNSRIEFDFGDPRPAYPPLPNRPLVVVVEAAFLTYRYRTLIPGDLGYQGVQNLLAAGPSIGSGVRRRIVTLDDLESYWPQASLRGGV